MKLEYSDNSPMRIAAFGAHYTKELKAGRVFETPAEAKARARKGWWVCEVRFLGIALFFTIIRLKQPQPWVKPGSILGMWNELTFIEQVAA